MVQDVGGRDMKLRPVKSGAPWRYVDVGGYYSGGLRFRHIQSPDDSGLFAFLRGGKLDAEKAKCSATFRWCSATLPQKRFHRVGFTISPTRR